MEIVPLGHVSESIEAVALTIGQLRRLILRRYRPARSFRTAFPLFDAANVIVGRQWSKRVPFILSQARALGFLSLLKAVVQLFLAKQDFEYSIFASRPPL